MLEMERSVRTGIETLIDDSRVPDFDKITLDANDFIHLGPAVTHNHCVASKLIREKASPLAQACWSVGSPQIRNRGTVVGNLVTASPANDTIPSLMALGATVVLSSKSGKREIPIDHFYLGVRKTVMQGDEMVEDVYFPAMTPNQKGIFVKNALRNAQAISVANICILLTFNKDKVSHASLTMGSVAPTVIHATQAEEFLQGKSLTSEVISAAAQKVAQTASPIDDLRSSAEYRKEVVRIIAERALNGILGGSADGSLPENPPFVMGDRE